MEARLKWLVSGSFEPGDVDGQSGVFIGCDDVAVLREWVNACSESDDPALIIIEDGPATATDLQAENERLRNALIHIKEYWNGSRTDGAMSDALDEIVSTARAALEGGEG